MTFIRCVQALAALLYGASLVVMVRTDMAGQKIRNRHLVAAVAAASACYLLLYGHSLFGREGLAAGYLTFPFYRDAGIYVACSMLAAFTLWWTDMWPAGDAKLFMLLSLLFPLLTLPGRFDPWRSPVSILINVFIPASAFLLVRSTWFVWRVYMEPQGEFLARLGWSRLPEYLLQARRSVWAWLRGGVSGAAADPLGFLARCLRWLVSMAFVSGVVSLLSGRVGSTLLVSGVCFGLMLAWQKAEQRLGAWVVSGGAALACAFLVDWNEPASFLRFFSGLSVFSLSTQWGMSLTRRLLEERGLVLAPVLGVFGWGLPMSVVYAIGGAGLGRTFLVWAVLGGAFGICYIFLKILEEQDRPCVAPDGLVPNLVLAPSFIERLRADPDFEIEDGDTFYADGLMPWQVDPLKHWCARNGVVLVPLRSTMSFALWIFLGFFITWVLKGHVLQFAY